VAKEGGGGKELVGGSDGGPGSRWTKLDTKCPLIKRMPLSDGIASNRRISASMPSADAPIPTTGNAVVAELPDVSVVRGSLWPCFVRAEACDRCRIRSALRQGANADLP
jgi:hypothetical protein